MSQSSIDGTSSMSFAEDKTVSVGFVKSVGQEFEVTAVQCRKYVSDTQRSRDM
jgi:hypothetical protein